MYKRSTDFFNFFHSKNNIKTPLDFTGTVESDFFKHSFLLFLVLVILSYWQFISHGAQYVERTASINQPIPFGGILNFTITIQLA